MVSANQIGPSFPVSRPGEPDRPVDESFWQSQLPVERQVERKKACLVSGHFLLFYCRGLDEKFFYAYSFTIFAVSSEKEPNLLKRV